MATMDLLKEMDELFRTAGIGRLFEPAFLPGLGASRYPRINLRETADALVVEALIPGIDPKELEMTVVKGTLTLAGERREMAGTEKVSTWHRRERGAGKFLRTIDIPAEIDTEKVSAEYRNGVLTVKLPKAEAAKPKRIAVQAG